MPKPGVHIPKVILYTSLSTCLASERENDIGLVKLDKSLDSTWFTSVQVAKISDDIDFPRPGQICRIAGWGRNGGTDGNVRYAEARVVHCTTESQIFCIVPENKDVRFVTEDYGTGIFCFKDGVPHLAGIFSDKNWGGYGYGSLRMSYYKKWIDSRIAALKCLTDKNPFRTIRCIKQNRYCQ
ncbi:hypothetical protein Ciccas_010707 [Cichlidogyrus casuarinus]|uniref:Peptidase S1 domain-containing protein n=1 Tax=Cichlidogyrus casuarinus TaxID=1844966 RepID=A0ABD2PVE0_9PLAT